MTNSVVHTQTRDSENERQRIDQIALLDIALRFNPDIICVGEMRGPEANAAQEAARVGIAVLTTIHSNSSEGTYRRMVSLCKRAVDTPDDTLMGYVTEAYPIVVYCRQLENKQRRITNISECEILPSPICRRAAKPGNSPKKTEAPVSRGPLFLDMEWMDFLFYKHTSSERSDTYFRQRPMMM